MALSFAVGIFIGMSPFLGFHTSIAFVVAWVCNLNKFITIVATYITNPFTIIPVYAFSTWFGAKLLDVEDILPDLNWAEVNFFQILQGMQSLLLPLIVGTFCLGLIFSLAGYIAVYMAVRKYRAFFNSSS
ncbi:MAG: DUF2062 domain-containing protein [Thermodesulfovibrionales bacterium]|nr:DUF2062 domain-containing protein [Thermodesulfovibrionales bacterium]